MASRGPPATLLFPPFSDIIRSSSSSLFDIIKHKDHEGPTHTFLAWSGLSNQRAWIDQIREEISHSPHPETLYWFYELFFIKTVRSNSTTEINTKFTLLHQLGAFASVHWPTEVELPKPPTGRLQFAPFIQLCFTRYVYGYLQRGLSYCVDLAHSWPQQSAALAGVAEILTKPGRRLSYAPSVPERVRSALQWLNPVDSIMQLLDPVDRDLFFFGRPFAKLGTGAERCTVFDLGIDALGMDIPLVGDILATECKDLAFPGISEVEKAALMDPLKNVALKDFKEGVVPALAGVYFALLGLWVNEILKVECRLPILGALAQVAGAFSPVEREEKDWELRKAALNCESVRVVSAAVAGFISVVEEFSGKILYYSEVDSSDLLVTLWAKFTEAGLTFEFDRSISSDQSLSVILHVVESYTGIPTSADAFVEDPTV